MGKNSDRSPEGTYILVGFLLEHNDAFDKTLQKWMDQGIIQFGQHLEEEYVDVIDGNTKKMFCIG